MGAMNAIIHESANTLMFELMLFPGDCTEIATVAINNGYYPRCLDLLSSTNPKLIGDVLFSLSNMVADNKNSAAALVKE